MAPNGAVMRTSALGVHRFHDMDHVTKNTADVAKITHFDPRFFDTFFFVGDGMIIRVMCIKLFLQYTKYFLIDFFPFRSLLHVYILTFAIACKDCNDIIDLTLYRFIFLVFSNCR